MNQIPLQDELQYICNQAGNLDIETPCITFEQFLYVKAFELSKYLQMNIAIYLGRFHMLMSLFRTKSPM